MADFLSGVSLTEAASVAFALAYLVLAIRRNRWCWAASFVSAALAVFVFASRQLYMQSALWAFFGAMAVYGWIKWSSEAAGDAQAVAVRTWPAINHVVAVAAIVAVSGVFAWGLSFTSQIMPVIDSFVTVASVLTTWMVAQRLLENWIYWFVIDSVSIYLFTTQAIWFYTGLYVIYLVLVVIGFRQWRAAL